MTGDRPKVARTELLDIAYVDSGPPDAPAMLLLHGWPDDATGWDEVARALNAAGVRTIAPWLRGFAPTRFRSPATMRDGRTVALAQDAIDLLDALGVERCSVVGHDWGGRAAYALAAIAPDRLDMIAALAIGYSPRGRFETPGFDQARRWWYQWYMNADGGADRVRADPVGFARIQWETWSPDGWFDEAAFARAARSFRGEDWAAITLHGYRSRWLTEPVDPRYADAQARIAAAERLSVPTLMIQGLEDRCDPPAESADDARWFAGGYRRVELDGAGHFPAREAPDRVAAAVLRFRDEATARRHQPH